MFARRFGMKILAYRFPDLANLANLHARGLQMQQDPGMGTRDLWGYLHLDDAARAIALGLVAPVTVMNTINVVARDSLGGVDVARIARELFPETRIKHEILAGLGAYDVSRAADILGFESQIRWDDRQLP